MEYVFLAVSALVSAVMNAVAPLKSEGAARIVVFKLDHIGDLVTATPALSLLRKRHPGAEITLVVGSWCGELARVGVDCDVVVLHDSPTFDRTGARSGRVGRASLAASLGHRSFDVAFGLRDDKASLLFCLLGGARRRHDRGTVRMLHALSRFRSALTGRGDPGPLHEIETNLRAVGARGHEASVRPPSLRVPEDARRRVNEGPLAGWDIREARLVTVQPGAVWEHRRWPRARYADLVRWLVVERGAAVAITGSKEERELAGEVALNHERCRVLAGELGVPEMAALLSRSDLYVGSETGMMHVASSVGTPVVALFGPGDPRRFGPVGQGHTVLYHRFECSPCPQRRCDREGRCMDAITLDEVTRAVAAALDRAGEGGAARPDEEVT